MGAKNLAVHESEDRSVCHGTSWVMAHQKQIIWFYHLISCDSERNKHLFIIYADQTSAQTANFIC